METFLMININKVSGSGITIILQDDAPLNGIDPLTQEQLNGMFVELQDVFSRYNFSIAMTGENEEMMRLQGRLMFKELYNMIDTMYAAKGE